MPVKLKIITMKKINIYLIARISKDAHAWNNKVVSNLDPSIFSVFKPQEHNPWNQKHELFSKEVFNVDLGAIKKSRIGLCLPEFGNDCSWECGWYSNSEKPLVAFIDDQIEWLRDWMIKGGLDYIITINKNTYDILINDPILKHKQIILISNINELVVELENIYQNHYQSKFFSHILNLRPYSWIDIILLGYLAKFSVVKKLIFSFQDFYWIVGVLSLWLFFNSLLEKKHGYAYRGKEIVSTPILYLLLALIIGLIAEPLSLIPVAISVLLVLLYLQKNKNILLGTISPIIRGLIQLTYFYFAFLYYAQTISLESIVLASMACMMLAMRSLIGDIRDIKHNKIANKRTLPVTLGMINSKFIITLLAAIMISVGMGYFGSLLISFPLILFAVGLLINKYGYVLHQLVIITTSFLSINLIALFTNQNVLFFNLIFLGIWINLIFYPLLKRKSNPIFVEQV